jgi:hypothetical protein
MTLQLSASVMYYPVTPNSERCMEGMNDAVVSQNKRIGNRIAAWKDEDAVLRPESVW